MTTWCAASRWLGSCAAVRGDRRFLTAWRSHTVATAEGELTFTVFPGPPPFIGASRLDGWPIAPVDARRLLADVGHEHAIMPALGDDDWVGGLGARRAM